MKTRQLQAHMQAAYVYAGLSYCVRRKVGCVIVKDDRIISIGYNGTKPGEDNTCEHEIVLESGERQLVTNPNVIHAEYNALKKLEGTAEVITDATMLFVTTVPCVACANKIVADGIRAVYYHDTYRKDDGLVYLLDHGVSVQMINP